MLRLYQEIRSSLPLPLESSPASEPRKLSKFVVWRARPIRIDDIGHQRSSRVDPLMRPRVALFGRAVQLIFAVGKNLDFNLASIEFSLAENAKALIVERAPVPELVFGTQDRESVFGLEISIHCIRKKTECVDENAQSGDWMIEWSGKILRCEGNTADKTYLYNDAARRTKEHRSSKQTKPLVRQTALNGLLIYERVM